MTWVAVSALVLSPFAGVLLWALVLRHVPLAAEAAAARIATPLDAAPVLAWARRLGVAGPLGREAAWRGAVEIGAIAVAGWSLAALPGDLVWPSCALGWLLLAAAAIDARVRLLPNEINLAIAALGLAQAALPGGRTPVDAAIGAAVGVAALALFAAAYARLRGRQGLGLGDAKLLGALGAWVGWQGLASIVTIAAGAALAWAALDALVHKRPLRGDLALPFGPFIALAGWLVWLYGPIGFRAA
jgi:leader peptidase (prepilin peptidase)/N-methyltransferase